MAKDWEHLGLKPHLSNNERLPRSYKEVEKVLKDVKACKGNLKTVLNNSRLRGSVFKKVYALAANVLKNRHILDRIIQETELLKKETFLREDLAGILIYELVFGKGLPGESRPVTVVKQYEDSILKAYKVAVKEGNLNVKGLQSLPRYVRVNTLLTTVSDVLKNLRKVGCREIYYGENTSEKEYLDLVRNLETGNFLIDYHFKDLLVFASTENLTTWSLYQKQHVYIQDKSSYIPVYALDPKPGSVVIDACAAPGMKTIHIAAAMENNGKIYAYEKSENRFQVLKDMLDHATVQICETECVDFYLVNANDPKFRDLECILVDPSCSGSGMVNRMDTVTDTEDSKNTSRLQKLAGFQILLLKHALTFPSVKRVVYSTCSISEEENEYVVHEVLNHFRHIFKLVSVMPNWPIRGSESYEFGKLCLRAHPEDSLTNGFFVAMFERLDYDEMLNVSRPFSEKSSKRKRKRKDNLDGRDSGINSMDYNVSEQQDNSQFLDENSSADPHNSSKKKKKEYIVENYFNQDYAENKEECAQLETDKVKKKKHSVKTDDKFESMTISHLSGNESTLNFPENDPNISSVISQNKLPKKRKKKETLETEYGENGGVEVLCENSATNTGDVEFLNFDLDGNSNFPGDCCFTNKSKKKKKKHKKEVSNCDVDIEDYKKNDTVEQTILENELDGRESEIKTKTHKHKKKHSKEKAEVCDNLEYIAENSLPESKMTSELKDTTSRKKHKKKHSKKDLEVADLSPETAHKNSLCHHEEASISTSVVQHKNTKQSFSENTEVLESYDEKLIKAGQNIEENCLKKKHKKKCKDKRAKEE
ncbi:putative 28S rRNA (cytosine-C(5))-methyltransferase [Araneus ventricosus]|uniref:Putative 28S rRNA (Cytosine-C(5))-methyltransferase n=1 Tax=Araneus ventricosus TaxID=182803 RepID=A0A4Y2NAC5_ARAVE|nr:putative 28S rRNA (cytosine-C(5))-methyltransferase [Araneus ventricosus]